MKESGLMVLLLESHAANIDKPLSARQRKARKETGKKDGHTGFDSVIVSQ
jgi:hypothetical protein